MNSRPLMISNAKRLFREKFSDPQIARKFIKSQAMLDELTVFVTGPNGRPQAAHGCYDDRVIAWAIGLTAIMYEVYGRLCAEDEPLPGKLLTGNEIEVMPRMSDVMDNILAGNTRGWLEGYETGPLSYGDEQWD